MLGSAFPKEIERVPKRNRDWYDIGSIIAWKSPDVVINCAGVTGFYKCEENPEKAYLANTAVPIEIACACKDVGAKMIHFSTFYVGEGIYYKSKQYADQSLSDMNHVSIIYLPTLFDENTLPQPYDENFHIALTYDVADWTMKNLDLQGENIFLCNE